MATQARIEGDRKPDGLDWITALQARQQYMEAQLKRAGRTG
jgi:hypothetical protein